MSHANTSHYTRIKARSVVCRRLQWSSVGALDCRRHTVGSVGPPASQRWTSGVKSRAVPHIHVVTHKLFPNDEISSSVFSSRNLGKAQKNKKCHTTITVSADRRNNPVGGDIYGVILHRFRHPNLCTILQAAMPFYCYRAFVTRGCVRVSFGIGQNCVLCRQTAVHLLKEMWFKINSVP